MEINLHRGGDPGKTHLLHSPEISDNEEVQCRVRLQVSGMLIEEIPILGLNLPKGTRS